MPCSDDTCRWEPQAEMAVVHRVATGAEVGKQKLCGLQRAGSEPSAQGKARTQSASPRARKGKAR